MRSRASKGAAFQSWCAGLLTECGFSVYNQQAVTRILIIGGKRIFCRSHKDILGCDIIAVKPDEKVLLVQASLDSHIEKRAVEFSKYGFPRAASVQLWNTSPQTGDVMVWIWDGKELKKVGYLRRRKFTCTDEWLALGEPLPVKKEKANAQEKQGEINATFRG